MTHVVCFMPFADWTLHSAREVTILQGLRQRGCTVSTVLCDGVFSDCDMHQPERPAKACLLCQAGAAGNLAKWGLPYRWLSRWLMPADFSAAAQWVAGLKPVDYAHATYGDWALGRWVRSSLHSHFRYDVLDVTEPKVAQAYASYLNSALLAALGLSRLYDEEKPAAQIVINGRMAVTRVALELAKARGIRTLCEERAYVLNRMMLFDDVNCLDNTRLNAMWADWQDTPLTDAECEALADVLHRRWTGTSGEMVISPPITATEKMLAELNLSSDRPLWVLYTSCMDECIDDPTWGGAFASQEAWIEATLAWAARRPDIQLAIRVHPNTGSARAIRSNPQELAYFAALAGRLPANVRLVDSTASVSSYGLAAAADVGLMWYSTVGLEMACMGRRVLRAGGGWCPGKSFLAHADAPETYPALLDSLAAAGPAPMADTIAAWRFAYLFFLRQSLPFPLVEVPTWAEGRMAYTSAAALAPGGDASLDRICGAIMRGGSLTPAVEERDPALATQERELVMTKLAGFQ